MVVQSLADVDFNPEREEISVFSKYSFSGHDKRIVGAVSVIFIQNDNSNSSDGKISDNVEKLSQKMKIPTSLSVIYLPQFGDILSSCNSSESKHCNTASNVHSNLQEPFSDLVSKKFVENLNLSSNEKSGIQQDQDSMHDTDVSEITNKSNEIQSDVKSQQDQDSMHDTDVSEITDKSNEIQSDVKSQLDQDSTHDKDVSEITDKSNKIQSEVKSTISLLNVSSKQEDDVETPHTNSQPIKEHLSTSQKFGSKEMVDVSTNTDPETENGLSTMTKNLKKFVDASTCVSMDNHDNTECSFTPVKRKRIDSIEFTDTENDSTNMFIITENKSSDSESQDSLEFNNPQNCINENTDSNSGNSVKSRLSPSFSGITGTRQLKDVESSRGSEVIVIESNNMEICENNKATDDDEEGFGNSGNVSVVDLSNVPVSYANLTSDQESKTLSMQNEKSDSVYKSSANMYSENVSSFDTKQGTIRGHESSFEQLASGNQRPKFMRSTSIQKGLNRNVIEKCKICKRAVTSLADMFHHSKIHNMGIKCCVCGMKAFDWNVMKHHYTWHIQRAAYRCPQCSTTCGSRDLLAAHLKTHTAAKSMIHLKNPKLRPPASKLIVSRPRTSDFQNIPNLNAINRPVSKTSIYSANNIKDKSSTERKGFVPFSQHMTSIPETVYNHSDQSQSSSSSHVDINPTQNVNQILNYSCGCCDEKFVNVEKLKRHVLMYHSEQTMSIEQQSDSSYPVYGTPTSNRNFVESENSASLSSAISSYPSENINTLNIKQEPEVIDIEQLGKFTENMENSMSTSSSDQFSQDFNQTSEQLEQEIMSSFMETSLSPTNRQRKTSCRLANVIPVCRFCGIFLNNWSEILEHRFSHPEEVGQQLACTVCSSVLSTRDSLKRHAINHMGIRHQCQFCHHEYSRKDSLMNHMRSAHGYSNHT